MEKELQLPATPEEEQTSVPKVLLGIIEKMAVAVQRQEENIQQLKDEVPILKGEKKRPKFKSGYLETDKGGNAGKRPGSKKEAKSPS